MFNRDSIMMPSFSNIESSGLVVKQEVELVLIDLISEQNIDLDLIDINTFLKLFKKYSYRIANKFISDAISFYFSHPQVLAGIQEGRITLFPNSRTLPDIDYNLLIPVFEKGLK